MSDDLMSRLEKTAGLGGGLLKGIGTYAKNVTNTGVRQAQKRLDNISPLPTQANKALTDVAKKDLHNAKVDRNIAMAGTAGVATAAGAGLGGYTAYQKSKEPVVADTMEQNQITQYQPKVANDLMESLEKTASAAFEQPKMDLMESLEKTANEAYGQNPEYQNHIADKRINEIVGDLYDKDPKYLESALQNEGLLDRAVQNGMFKDITPGEGLGYGAAAGGVMGGLTGLAQGAIIGASEGTPFKGAGIGGLAGGLLGAGIGGAVGGIEGLHLKKHPSELHLKYHGGQNAQPTSPDVQPAHEENPRQGAGSVSHAPAGEDKTASELMERLEKTAAEWKEDGAAGADLGARVSGTLGALGGGIAGGIAGYGNNGPAAALVGGGLGAIGGGLLGAAGGAAGGGLVGALYGGAKDAVGYDHPEGESNVGPTALAGAGIGALSSGVQGGAMTGSLRGAVLNGLAGGLSGGIVGGAVGAMRDHREEAAAEEAAKEASELMDRLEKTAGLPGISNLASKGVAKVKNFAGNVTGVNAKKAKNTFDTWNTPEALKANSPQMGVAKFRQHLEGLEGAANKAKADTKKAQIGAGIAGAGAVGAGAVAAGKDKEEKTASVEDDVLTGLFKEAAAAIIEEKLPEVKQHVDPMSRIKF